METASYESHGNNVAGEHAMPRALAATGTTTLGVDASFKYGRATKNVETLGWSVCGCGAPFTPGTVLDPFAGTGTTLAVADLHGRDAIGIDIDARNQQLYEQRRAECARNLFDSPMPDTNQLDLFGGVA